MDQYALQKLGNVTIKKIPSSAEVSNDANVSVATKEPAACSIGPRAIQLPKLPPSINITIKANPSCAVGESADDVESQYSDRVPSSSCAEIQTKEADGADTPSELGSPCESPSEICDNLSESKNVDNESVEPIDCQELSESVDDEYEETEFGSSAVVDDKMEDKEGEKSLDKDYEEAESEVKEEFVEEYGEGCDDVPEVPVNELIEGEVAESVICKEEFSDKESDTTSDDADDEVDEEQGQADEAAGTAKRKKKRKTKSEDDEDESTGSKKQKTSPEKTESEETSTSELKVGSLRRNIREVMDETKLDEATLSAQMQEKERLRRVQEQLRANRDIHRQMMQAKVLSLIEAGGTSLSSWDPEEYPDVEEQKPNTVVVKLHSGSGPQRMLDLLKKQKTSSDSEEDDASLDKFASLSRNLSKPQMMTSSVSIAPVKHEPKMTEIKHEAEDEELVETADDDDDDDIPKNKDIVMISSSSSSSSGEDDDCIVISEDEESEPEEDTGNSGMHTNDLYNVPDEQGRVLINVGHSENEEDVFLAPQIARIIKPHQIGGVRFLFDNIVESLSRFTTSEGFGCILAHSMGLGKTLQVVSFCDVFLRYTEGRSVLCIMPINTLQNWVAEFNMWLPVDPEATPLKEQGEVLSRHFPLFVLNDNQKSLTARAKVIQNWYREGGVLLIGYELYRQLCLKKSPKVRLRSKKKEIEEDIDDEKSKSLLETMYNALVKPGPDLVICDEGHRIKNSHASISHALKQIRSKRRVVLTGYPLQNNLLEYWCMVDFVRPNYLGTKTEFSNMFERPIQNGQCIDSTPQDVKLMRYRAHVLHSLLEGFVQRRSHRVLQQTLPQKYEFVMLLKLTSFQKKLYNTFMNEVVRTKAVPNPLKAFAVCCKIWNHPDILHYFLKKRAGEEDIDLDLDETVPIGTPASDSSAPMTPSTPPHLLASKRGRTPRKTKDKPPRKNARTSTPQPINKPPSMAAIPPNTANNPKPPNPEHAITSANNQPIPPFNSYNNQFQTFNQASNENANFSQSSGTSGNFGGGQFSQSEYSPNQAGGNVEYNNFQQNYNEGGNYYQSEYEQPNNYWPGANNDDGHFYGANGNNSAASTADTFYPSSNSSSSSSSQSTSQSYSNEFGGSQGESSQSDYGNQNFNYANQSMQQFPREFAAAKPDMGGLQSYSQASGMESAAAGDLNASSMYPTEVSRADMNFAAQHQSPGGNMDHQFAGPNVHKDGMAYSASRDAYTSAGNVDLTGAEQNAFNSFTPPPMPKSRRGRPPSQSPRAVASRQKRANAKAASQALAAQNVPPQGTFPPPLFKPGLLGGAPLKTGTAQSFAADPANPNMQPAPHLFHGSDMAANYQHGQMPVQGMAGEGMWNAPPPGNQNAVFADQNYGMYNEMAPQTNSNFIANEAPAMMNEAGGGNVRGSRNLLNDIQPSEIFNPPEGGYAASNADGNIFNLDNFNYLPLNDLPMTGHTSFMGLLEGVDSMEMGQGGNLPPAAAQPPPSSQAMGSGDNAAGNYMEPLQFRATDAASAPINAMTSTALSNKESPYSETVGLGDAPAAMPSSSCRDVSDSLLGLARKGQITLKKVNKKSENVVSPPEKADAEFAQGRLPSMDMFGGGGAANQNFAASGSAESANFGQSGGQYGFSKGQSASTSSTTSSLSTQTNWEPYGSYSNEYNAQGMVEKGPNFGNFGAAATSHEAPRNKSKATAPFERAPNRIGTQTENYDNATARDTACQERLASQPANSAPKKQPEDDIPRNFYQTTNSGTEIEASKNVFAANAGSSGSSVTIEKNLMPQTRNPLIIPPSEVFKPENLKTESEDADSKMGPPETPASKSNKEEPGIPYDWALEFFKDYNPGKIEASAKTLVFFCMLDEIIRLGDRLLLFSQSLFTLDLLEDFLNLFNIPNTEEKWARNKSYFRLDGSTSALEREKLINEFNQNPNVHLFLVSTRAGSLGINLVGANRVVVFDASWNPCHDTQAVCRVYRYGQQKPCYVYRFVMDSCLEKKIYDRQINKQGLSDRIVDECNPDAHLTIKDVANLCWDDVDLTENKKDFHEFIDKYDDVVMKKVIKECGAVLSKEPFQHESLLVDRADKKLSQAEKRMAKRGYELEKQASLKPTYGLYTPLNMQNRMKPTASVRPMPAQPTNQRENVRRWIPAEVWQKQGMSAQEMTLPLDVVIPTGTADNRSEIKLDAGQKVIVLKSPKGIYMQLENGKIIAIKAALKPDGGPVAGKPPTTMPGRPPNPVQMAPKMPLKPPVDRNLAALSNRRGVTVSPIRQRFPMRPQPSMGMPNMPPRPQGLNRAPSRPSQQPMPRPFPQSSRSPQGRSPSRGLTAPPVPQPQPKSLFGPNSAVSISVANQKNMESQIRGPMGVDQPMGRGAASRSAKDEFARNYEKEGTGHLTEVSYDDYPSGAPREPMSRGLNEARKAATPMNEYSSSSAIDGGYGSRLPYAQPAPRDGRVAPPYAPNNPRAAPARSDALAESLKYKKDINLTPVAKSAPPRVAAVDKQPTSEPAKAKLPHVAYRQPHQQPHQQHPYQMSATNKMAAPKPAPVRGRPAASLATDAKPKKDGAATKSVELPKSSAISIFPVGKKGEEGAPAAFQQDSAAYQTSKGDFYGSTGYPTKQPFAGNYSESQFAHQYDSYKPSYQPGFAGQSEYSPQPSFQNAPYAAGAYAGEGFSAASYAENSSQYSNAASMYANQPPSQSYDQYGSYYGYGQKSESAPAPARAPSSSQSASQ